MGKPFKKELSLLPTTYQWATDLNIQEFANEVKQSSKQPLLAVGSGGSLSACYYATLLHQSQGRMAKATTPLELFYSRTIINSSSVFFLSASGRNTDILTAFKSSINEDPNNLFGLTLNTNTPLATLAQKNNINTIIGFKNPVGKDGFLATNSLLAFFTILYRAYGNINLANIFPEKEFHKSIADFIDRIDKSFTFKILYAGWSHPVAIDIESKFTESALGNVLLCDYRNFGHGRHHWLDKRGKQTAIIALITPSEKELAEKTLALIPKTIPILRIETQFKEGLSSINLLVNSFYLADKVGEMQNIDPGKPGVPSYGSKLYHLNYSKTLDKEDAVTSSIKNAIQRKLSGTAIYTLPELELKSWISSQKNYVSALNTTKFNCIVFDYDGTLCAKEDRYSGIKPQISKLLNQLLAKKIFIGIATGRGDSVRDDLRTIIERKYWDNVIIGYYNGGETSFLSDDTIPNISPTQYDENLSNIFSELTKGYKDALKLKLKRRQLTVEFKVVEDAEKLKNQITQMIYSISRSHILCVESGHSIDVIVKPDVSKINVVNFCQKHISKTAGVHYETICIGDKGRYPGNDFELLNHKYSLSVDEVSSLKDRCWNLSSSGVKGVNATLEYIEKMKLFNGYFKMAL